MLRLIHRHSANDRAATHAVFGLLNATRHSTGELSRDTMARLLHAMASDALTGAFRP